jgi:hypothetical protein
VEIEWDRGGRDCGQRRKGQDCGQSRAAGRGKRVLTVEKRVLIHRNAVEKRVLIHRNAVEKRFYS